MNRALRIFGKVGLVAAKAFVPGVAQAEAGILALRKSGGEGKREAVLQLVQGALTASGELTGQHLADPDLLTGLRMINDGNVLVMKALGRLFPSEDDGHAP